MSKYNFEQKRNDYLSPIELVVQAMKKLEINRFSLDTCCSIENIPAYDYFIDGQKDGLKENWQNFNWCNPPFDICAKWIKKAYEEQQKGKTTAMLIPVRTETKYWHEYILFNPNVEIEWLRKGYSFLNPDDLKPMGVFKNALALVYFKGV